MPIKLETIKGYISKTVFFIGWLLSPFTFWNDSLVNIPIAYLLANVYFKIARSNFVAAVLVFYWGTNILGILLMYIAGRNIIAERGKFREKILNLVLAMLIYSALLILLDKIGVLKPFYK